MKYRHIDWRPAKRLMIHGGLWTDMNLPRFHVGWEEGCEYLAFDYGNEGADPVIGVSLDLAGTRVGRVLGEGGWRIYRWRHPAPTPDPTHGRIDADIQATVEQMQPPTLGARVAMENTLQHRRDQTASA